MLHAPHGGQYSMRWQVSPIWMRDIQVGLRSGGVHGCRDSTLLSTIDSILQGTIVPPLDFFIILIRGMMKYAAWVWYCSAGSAAMIYCMGSDICSAGSAAVIYCMGSDICSAGSAAMIYCMSMIFVLLVQLLWYTAWVVIFVLLVQLLWYTVWVWYLFCWFSCYDKLHG